MYAHTYGFGQGANNAQQPVYNHNGSSAPQPSQQQFGQQPQQHMMYNPQQYGGGGHQIPYGGMGVNPAMMQSNSGMAHIPANNGIVQGYQTPYSSSPYGAGIPSSTSGPPMQQPYMTPTSNASSFGMNAQNMTPQQHQQRMQPPQASTPAGPSQRISPYGGAPHNTPPAQTQAQFMTPQNPPSNQSHQAQTPLQTQSQNPSQTQQPQGQQTPQTPNFPPNSAGAAGPNLAVQTPLSPGSETREKERVSLLLDINRELLMEVMRLQALQAEAKKEAASPTTMTTEGQSGDAKPTEKPSAATTGKEYVECMRRLQANLAYLAAIADRSHKPSAQIPPHPAIISAPPLSPLPAKPQLKTSPKASPNQTPNVKTEGTSTPDAGDSAIDSTSATSEEETEDRIVTLKSLYTRLQALFPGVDPKKEAPIQSASKNAQQKVQQAQRQNTNPAQKQNQNQMPS